MFSHHCMWYLPFLETCFHWLVDWNTFPNGFHALFHQKNTWVVHSLNAADLKMPSFSSLKWTMLLLGAYFFCIPFTSEICKHCFIIFFRVVEKIAFHLILFYFRLKNICYNIQYNMYIFPFLGACRFFPTSYKFGISPYPGKGPFALILPSSWWLSLTLSPNQR